MQGDEHFDERFGGTSGYYVMGKVLAIGYMKALAESIEKTASAYPVDSPRHKM